MSMPPQQYRRGLLHKPRSNHRSLRPVPLIELREPNMTDLLTRARFAADNPHCLHSPAAFREIIRDLLAENARLRAGQAVAVARDQAKGTTR